MSADAVALSHTAEHLPEYWSQQVVGEANGSLFKVAKGIGETHWHRHDDQDEVFVVTHGELVIELRTGDVRVGVGELHVVPRGVEHRPRADAEVHLLLVGTGITSTAEGDKPDWSRDGGAPPA